MASSEIPYESKRSHYAVEYSHAVTHMERVSGHSPAKHTQAKDITLHNTPTTAALYSLQLYDCTTGSLKTRPLTNPQHGQVY